MSSIMNIARHVSVWLSSMELAKHAQHVMEVMKHNRRRKGEEHQTKYEGKSWKINENGFHYQLSVMFSTSQS